jgi:hypothetical protein
LKVSRFIPLAPFAARGRLVKLLSFFRSVLARALLSCAITFPPRYCRPTAQSHRISAREGGIFLQSQEHYLPDTAMDGSRLLALPPELRIMIYAYLGPPTIAHTRNYRGLRQTCRFLRIEYDVGVLKFLRREYQNTSRGYMFIISSPDWRSLEIRIEHDASQPLPDFRSFSFISWNLPRLWTIRIVYAPCGQRSIDNSIVISICQAIARGLAHVPRPPSPPILGLDRYHERMIVLRQIFFRWDENELGTVEVNKVSDYRLYQPSCYNCKKVDLFVVLHKVHCWWKALVRGNTVSFDTIEHHDENHVLTGYEWHQCQERDNAMGEMRKLALMVVLPVLGFLTILDISYNADLIRTNTLHAYFMVSLTFSAIVDLIRTFMMRAYLMVVMEFFSGADLIRGPMISAFNVPYLRLLTIREYDVGSRT